MKSSWQPLDAPLSAAVEERTAPRWNKGFRSWLHVKITWPASISDSSKHEDWALLQALGRPSRGLAYG